MDNLKEQEVVTDLSNGNIKLRPALCLDLDGTVRRSATGQTFIKNFKDIELMPNIEKIIWKYKQMGWLVIAISNQAGVAHGFKLPMEIESEMDTTKKLFNRNPFDLMKWCYHDDKGKIEPYNHRSLFRKPNIGMLAECENDVWEHGIIIDWDNSLFVGDRPEDEQCAKNAGIPFRHIDNFLNEPHTFTIDEK